MTKREKEFQKADMYLLSFVVLTLIAAAILLPIMVEHRDTGDDRAELRRAWTAHERSMP